MFWGEQDVNYLEGTSCLERITSDLFALIDDYKALFPYLTEVLGIFLCISVFQDIS